jgi:predicted acylesterase/phospholipase RssA
MGRRASEVRLAIVMNGGVSLAVWMGGVTHEIDLLRRASRVPPHAERDAAIARIPAHDAEIFWRWVQFCREGSVARVVVDVVAGTSAGGLNGTLLATSVALGAPLDAVDGDGGPWLREMWGTEAALDEGKLVRSRRDPDQPSILDGDYFHGVVDKVVGELAERADGETGGEAVTLFVTATALGTADRRYTDSFGQPFDTADHRRLYRFSRRDDDAVTYVPGAGDPDDGWWQPAVGDDFRSAGTGSRNRALTAAARASASFPFSFEPVEEDDALAAQRVQPPPTVEPHGGRWLVDGGVLDNAPFQPVLDAIARRPLRGQVRRLLVNVVPSGGTAGQQAESDGDRPAWPAIAGAVVGFPRESDQRDDVERSEQLLSRGEGAAAAPEALYADAIERRVSLRRAADDLLPQYSRARAVGGLLELRADLARAEPDLVTRLTCRRVGDADTLLALEPIWVPAGEAPFEAYGADQWRWGLGAAERVLRMQLRDLRRRLPAGDEEPTAELVAAVQAVGVELSKVEAVRDDVGARVRRDPPPASQDDESLVSWLGDVFVERRVPEALARCVRRAADAYASAVGRQLAPADAVRSGLEVEVCSQAFTAYAPFDRTAPFELLRLGPDVETPLVDRNPGAVRDARAHGEDKLYGTRLKHFAAFGLVQWRYWDWTCGRLDAQVHLARALTLRPDMSDQERHSARTAADQWVAQTQALTLEAELPAVDDYAAERDRLWAVTDHELVRTLRRTAEGEQLVLRVVDAAMRALPDARALGGAGALLNTLLARRPARRLPPLWAVPVRLITRRTWSRRVARYGHPR